MNRRLPAYVPTSTPLAEPFLKMAARQNERMFPWRALRRMGLGLGAALWATTALDGPAFAQNLFAPPPPLAMSVDSNGVDLIGGTFNISDDQAVIGGPGGMKRTIYGGALASLDNYTGTINASSRTLYTVSIGAQSDTFSLSGSTFTSLTGDGATLTQSGSNYTYMAPSGSVAVFSTANVAYSGANIALITSLTSPNGQVLTFTYNVYDSPTRGEPVYYTLLQSVASNLGYQIEYKYSGALIAGVIGINSAVNYCNPTTLQSCTGLTVTWPQVALNYGATVKNINATGTATDALGRVTTYTTSPTTSQTIRRPSGETLTINYNSSGQVTSFSNGTGTWTYTYSTSGTTQTTTVTDPLNHTRTVVSNLSIDKVTSDTDGLGHTTTYAYDGYGRMTQATNPEGDYTQYVYDNRSNVTQTTKVAKSGSGLANVVTYASYDASCTYAVKCNKPNSTTDALGNVTSYTYSTVHGGVLTVTKPAVNGVAPVTAYSYAQVATYALNSAGTLGQVGSIWEPTGTAACATSAASVAASSTTASLSCAAGAGDLVTTSISYAGSYNAEPTSVTRGNGSVSATTSIAYDTFGNVVSKIDALGNQTALLYDADRELIGAIGPDPDGSGPLLNRAVRLTYDGGGRVTLAEQGTTSGQSGSAFSNFSSLSQLATTYNALNQKLSDEAEVNGAPYALTQYDYDAAGRSTCTVVRMNVSAFGSEPGACYIGTQGNYGPDRMTYIGYDNANHPVERVTGDGSSTYRVETSSYGADGEVIAQVDAKGNLTSYNVDGFNRPYQIFFPNPSNGGSSSTTDYEQYTYDANSNLTYDRRRDGQIISYTYDALNRPTTTANGGTLAYNNLGQITSATRNGQTNSFTYDALSRKLSESQTLGTVSSGYDADGHRTSLTYPDGYAVSYAYDATGALSSVSDPSGLIASYTYDNLGRLTALTRNGGPSTSLSYSAADLTLSGLSHTFSDGSKNVSFGYAHSPAGQLITSTSSNSLYNYTVPSSITTNYSVDGQNKLTGVGGVGVSSDARGNLTSDGTASLGYSYDVANELTSTSAGASLSYDALGRLLKTVSGSTTTQFLYDGSQIMAEYVSGKMDERYVLGAGVDQPLVWFKGTGTATTAANRLWLLPNHQGSIIAVANATTTTVINTYDEAGNRGSSNSERFQFQGMPFINVTGLYHDRARDYDPNIGRFMQTDPIGYGDGFNWYNYVHGDPVNGWDPSGLDYQYTVGGYTTYCIQEPGDVGYGSDDDITGDLSSPDSTSSGNCYTTTGAGGIQLTPYTNPLSSIGGGISKKSPAMAPQNMQIIHTVPVGALVCTTSTGVQFYAPPNFDFNAIVSAGSAGGLSPFAANSAVGHFGTYDYQRVNAGLMGTAFYSAYTNASNFAVGAYLQGAGFSQQVAGDISNTFAGMGMMSSNAGSAAQNQFRDAGYQAAAGGGVTCVHQ